MKTNTTFKGKAVKFFVFWVTLERVWVEEQYQLYERDTDGNRDKYFSDIDRQEFIDNAVEHETEETNYHVQWLPFEPDNSQAIVELYNQNVINRKYDLD